MRRAILLLAVLGMTTGITQADPARRIERETHEWTFFTKPEAARNDLPNVLIVGDSIARGYFGGTAAALKDRANSYLFATSKSVGDPALAEELATFFRQYPARFDVVVFNNGMHGWAYSEEEFEKWFPEFVDALRAGAPEAKFIWVPITPVRNDRPPRADGSPGCSNGRIDARNRIAEAFLKTQGIAIRDFRPDLRAGGDVYADDIHFNEAGIRRQAASVAEAVADVLPTKR